MDTEMTEKTVNLKIDQENSSTLNNKEKRAVEGEMVREHQRFEGHDLEQTPSDNEG